MYSKVFIGRRCSLGCLVSRQPARAKVQHRDTTTSHLSPDCPFQPTLFPIEIHGPGMNTADSAAAIKEQPCCTRHVLATACHHTGVQLYCPDKTQRPIQHFQLHLPKWYPVKRTW